MKRILLFLFVPFVVIGQSTIEKAQLMISNKQYLEVEQLMTNYVSQFPDDLRGIELLGDAYGFQKKWDKAIVRYKKLVMRNQSNANYHYKYGGALGMKALAISKIRALGIIGDVKSSFLKAAELDPEHIDARWALVELYMQLPGIFGGSKKKSLKYAEELEQLSAVDGYLAKGYIFEYDDQPKLAEYYYKLAITEGGSLTCFSKLAEFYQNENQPGNAILTFEKSYKNHHRNNLHYQIGKVCADYNIELDKGERCLQKYIKNYSAKDGVPIEWAYFRLAQISKNRVHKEQALRWIDKALNVRSDFKQALEEKEKILRL